MPDDQVVNMIQDLRELAEDIKDWTEEGPPPRWKYADWQGTAETLATRLEADMKPGGDKTDDD